MTTSLPRWQRWSAVQRDTVVLISWATRAFALLCIASVVFAPVRRRFGDEVRDLWGISGDVGLAGAVITLLAGVILLVLANGLRRRKLRAWQLALTLSVLVAVGELMRLHRGHPVGPAVVAGGLAVLLLVTRRSFTARPDPVRATGILRVVAYLLFAGFVSGWLLLVVNPGKVQGSPGVGAEAAQAALALIGLDGPVHLRSPWLSDLTAAIGLSFGIAAALTASYQLLRTFEPPPRLDEHDERRVRTLLARWADQDSLAYFALRGDKSVLFSPSAKACVSYRVLAGVALASGDPLGDPEAWPGAIHSFLTLCQEYAWTPAALGCSERGAQAWVRHGLDVLELGDEAVLELAEFTLQGRAMRGVRQAVARIRRAGYTVTVSRVSSLTHRRREQVITAAARWRGPETERGFSMALSRLADPTDPDNVVVVAEQHGVIRGILQLVPWGERGLSLDQMRRDPTADNGINDFMIAELTTACADLGIERISLNFAVLRAALERGKRIGAGPVARVSFKLLRLASRWWQIESLYRFNARFRPHWVPRYIAFPRFRALPAVALAALEAEGFGGRPPALLRVLRRNDCARTEAALTPQPAGPTAVP